MRAVNKIKASKSLAPIDIFGPDVALTFHGDRKFKSNFGGVASLICMCTVFFIMVLKTKELLLGHEEAAHYMTETAADDSEPINLADLEFTFAVNQIDPRLGRVSVNQINWSLGASVAWQKKEKTPIQMIDCNESTQLNENQEMYDQLSTEALRKGRFFNQATFLCPNSTDLVIQGQTDSEMFSYVEISILGCDLPEGECADISEVENTYLQFFAL